MIAVFFLLVAVLYAAVGHGGASGYLAVMALAGFEPAAMKAIAADCPDIAVSDLAMPGEDGYRFVKRVRALSDDLLRALPLVAMTAYARAEDRHRVLAAGFQRHVAKPIEPSELVEALAEVVAAHKTANS